LTKLVELFLYSELNLYICLTFEKNEFIDYKRFLEMTKADIVNEISKNTGIEKVTVQKTVEAFMDSIKTSLETGSNVYLRGFGSFVVKKRAEKTARNISKNTTIIIPEHFIPSFKPAKTFVGKVKSKVKK
jgi:DNA-binding protein HU-beta